MKSDFQNFFTEASQVLYDRQEPLRLALVSLLADGHLLLEDTPGSGKTTFALTLAKLLGLGFRRVQMTSDLLPADVLGSSIFDRERNELRFHEGPIFSHVLLADELNRASPRAQSAFLEAMEERQVSSEGQTRPLPKPFFVIATQNPYDSSGTHPLPEGQLDRFLICLSLGFPSAAAESRLFQEGDPREKIPLLPSLWDPLRLIPLQEAVKKVKISPTLASYLQALVAATRLDRRTHVLSPRAGQHAARAARAWAFLEGRDFALPEDVKKIAPAVWGHRLGGNEGSQRGRERVYELLERVSVPI